MDVRPATDDDGAGIAEVRDAIGGQHDDSGSDATYRAHLMAHGRLFVAVRGGRVIGFAGARDVGGHRLLSDLFVDPHAHGGGVGRVLLATVLDGSEERYTFSSSDPRALPIYARAGMRPRWPLLYLRGPAPEVATEALEAVAVEPAEADDVAAVERAVTGVDRAVEHRYWARRPGASAAIVRIDGAAVGAVSFVVRNGETRIEHLALAPATDAGLVVAAVGAVAGAPTVRAFVPGPQPLLEWLLHRRFVVDDIDTFMSSHADAVPSALAIVHPGLG
ncbi:MAG TPA: GNAT family N-acetyltransferase [Ilumatobacteraceae bacterium]